MSTQDNMSNKTVKPESQVPATGRIAFDDRGNAIWQWRSDTGTFKSDIDTRKVRALQEATTAQLGGEAQVAAPAAPPPPSNDPYSTADSHALLAKKAPRRTLDDMRKLSEEIKRARAMMK
jgi:hypothetical protein